MAAHRADLRIGYGVDRCALRVARAHHENLQMKRIVPKRKNGLFNPDAPFWKGERAEHIVQKRVAGYKKKKRKPKK
jgi:hypothetical protein